MPASPCKKTLEALTSIFYFFRSHRKASESVSISNTDEMPIIESTSNEMIRSSLFDSYKKSGEIA